MFLYGIRMARILILFLELLLKLTHMVIHLNMEPKITPGDNPIISNHISVLNFMDQMLILSQFIPNLLINLLINQFINQFINQLFSQFIHNQFTLNPFIHNQFILSQLTPSQYGGRMLIHSKDGHHKITVKDGDKMSILKFMIKIHNPSNTLQAGATSH